MWGKIKAILAGLLFVGVFLFILDFMYVIALNQNSFFIAGVIDLFFWGICAVFGIIKLFASSCIYFLHAFAPNVVPEASFHFSFLSDLFIALGADLLIIVANSISAGGTILFKMVAFVFNLFAKEKIEPNATKITLYNLIGDIKLIPGSVEKDIVLLNLSWFDNLFEHLSKWALSNVKTSRYLLFHDVLGLNMGFTDTGIVDGKTISIIDRLTGGGGSSSPDKDPNSPIFSFT